MTGPTCDFSLLPQDWSDVWGSVQASELEAELARELSPGHALAGRRVAAVAVRRLRKEVIFQLTDEGRWAWVHLTWTFETDARWPWTVIRATWQAVVDELRDAGRG